MAIAAQREGTGTSEYGIWRVIMASSVGTMIEWYDFYIFGSLAAILSLRFYPPGHDTFALIAYLATFAVGFLVRPAPLPLRLCLFRSTTMQKRNAQPM